MYCVLCTKTTRATAGSFNIDVGSQVQSRVAINQDLGTFVQKSFSAVILVAGLATFMFLIWGGIQWITSGGDKGKTQEARDRITAALVGLAVVASAWAVMLIIQYFFGISILNENITPPKAY